MLNVSRRLYELQLIDQEIGARKEALAGIARQTAESDLLSAAKGRLESDREKLAKLEEKHRSLEAEAEDQRAKIKEEQSQADAGGKGSKELQAFMADIESRSADLKTKEDVLIELMAEIDKYRERVNTDVAGLAEVEKKWGEERAALQARQTQVSGELEEFEKKRAEAATGISPEHLQLYEASKPSNGVAVAKVDRGRCSGCHIGLSVSEVQRTRKGDLVRCSNCGRILFFE